MQSDKKMTAGMFAPVFFLSGLAGLACQVIWGKALAAAVGHEFPAVLAVVTAFMAGMACGNALLMRAGRIDARWYGWLEGIIGFWGAAVILLLPWIDRAVYALAGIDSSPSWYWAVVFPLVFLLLLPATAAMGATLPAAERFLFAVEGRQTTGLLYAANSAGATIGALLAAFWLMPMFGIRVSLTMLAGLNLLCGAVAVRMARGAVPKFHSVESPRADRQILLPMGVLGLLGIGFEVGVVRALSHVLENTVYTFAVVLAAYLAGNALGAAFFQRWQSRGFFREPGILFSALALACLVESIAIRWIPGLYTTLRETFSDELFAVAAAEAIVASAIFFAPALLMGAAFAAVAQSSLAHRPNLAAAVAVNLAGGALAPILFGLGLIPRWGLKGALATVATGYAVLGIFGRCGANEAIRRRQGSLHQLGDFIMIVVVIGGAFLIISAQELVRTDGARMLSFEEGVMGSVAVLESGGGARVLKFNNRFQMGGTAARMAEQRQADVPLLLHPDPKRALFIGLGSGITFATAAEYRGLRADGVELAPEIAKAMPFFTGGDLPDALRVYLADGRRFVQTTTNRYDVIVGDLFHPAQDGAGFLYTREHFAAVRSRLREGGLFCQWLPLHQMDLRTVRVIMRTFAAVFPGAEVWLLRFNIDTPVVGLVGYNGRSEFSTGWVEGRAGEHLRETGLADSVRLFGCFVGKIPQLPGASMNTDANPAVMFLAPAITFQRRDAPGERLLELIELCRSDVAALPWKTQGEWVEQTRRFVHARDVYLTGLVQETHGDLAGAVRAYIESARLSPDFTAGYAQALTLASALASEKPEVARSILEQLMAAQPNRPVARELLMRLER